MLRRMAEVEWSWAGSEYALVTLTWPGEFRGDPRSWKAQTNALRLRWQRRWEEPMHAMWALEWQRPRPRGASQGQSGPHFHLVVALPRGVPLFRVRATLKRDWTAIVAPGDLDHAKHGADVTQAHWYSAALYLAREVGKRRQKELPVEWSTGAGRWWGTWNLDVVEQTVRLTGDEFHDLRRALRRLARRSGYRMKAKYRDQGGALFGRGSRWSLWYSMVLLLETGPPRGSLAVMDARAVESLTARPAGT